MIWGFGRSKRRLAKAAGAEPAGQMRDEKLHAVAARSAFASQNVQNLVLGALLEVEMSKKCTPLWREAHFQVNRGSDHFWKLRCRKSACRCGAKHISKSTGVRTTFGSYDVEKVHAVVARSTFRSQNVQNTPCTDHFWRFRCRFAWG